MRRPKSLPLPPMRISQAGLQSDLPTTRFSARSSSRRESYLGLRSRLAPQITSHTAPVGRVPLVGALRSAAPEPTPVRRQPGLRRSDAMTWSAPGATHSHRPRRRSATPWRG